MADRPNDPTISKLKQKNFRSVCLSVKELYNLHTYWKLTVYYSTLILSFSPLI